MELIKPKMTKRKMHRKMRKILRYVESGGDPEIHNFTDSDLWGECVKRGFLNAHPDSGQDEAGFWHIILINHNITPEGIEWLYAPNAAIKSTISLAVSISALLVSVLSNLSEIISACESILKFLGLVQ